MKGLPEGIERIAKRKENGESSGDHFSKVYSQSFFWAGLAAKLKLHSVRGGGVILDQISSLTTIILYHFQMVR